jgi:hypothetical protein
MFDFSIILVASAAKIQNPSSNPQINPNIKIQNPKLFWSFSHWCFDIVWDLVLGI